MKAAVAQLGKDTETTAKAEPGAELAEKRQQKRLQVNRLMMLLVMVVVMA